MILDEFNNEEVTTNDRDWTSEAASMGWNKDYDGPDKLDPKEFVLRKPLYDEQKKLKKKVKELEHAIRTQSQMQEQLLQRERDSVIASLKEEKKLAIESGDAGRVIELDEEIDKAKNITITAPSIPKEFSEWASQAENSWYGDDEDMTAWADAYGYKSLQKNPNKPIIEIYNEITKRAKEIFPTKFKNTNKDIPSKVEGANRSKNSDHSPNDGEGRIPKDYKQVFHTMWRSGAWGDITKKEAAKKYVADLEKIGAIESGDE